MRRSILALVSVAALIFGACGSSASPTPSTGGGGASPGAGGSAGAGGSPGVTSGTAVLSGWQSSPAEGNALTQTLLGFQSTYPNIKVDYQPVAGDYPTVMATNFASKSVPDVFYVDAAYASTWIKDGFLAPLDSYISSTGFDTSQFFPGYASIFKGTDGKTYGLPKDGNTIAMAYNTDLVTSVPKTMNDLITLAQSLKGKSGLKAPMCLNPGLDRGLAFLYAQGGSLLSDDGKTEQIDTPASKAAVQWYMDLFKNGLGQTNTQLGDGWCGEALGKGDVAIAFEGGWLKGAMDAFPKIKWQFAEMPTGTSGTKVTINYTAAYGIGVDSKNKDQAWVLMQYLTGPEGMAKWTEGGIAVPSRSDVAVPAGFEIIVKGADYAKPGSGFMPGYPDVQKAFGDEFLKQITDKKYDAGPVVDATKAKIDQVLASQ